MFDFFDTVAEFFSDLWDGICAAFDFLVDFVTGIIDLLSMAEEALSTLEDSISALPDVLVTFATNNKKYNNNSYGTGSESD